MDIEDIEYVDDKNDLDYIPPSKKSKIKKSKRIHPLLVDYDKKNKYNKPNKHESKDIPIHPILDLNSALHAEPKSLSGSLNPSLLKSDGVSSESSVSNNQPETMHVIKMNDTIKANDVIVQSIINGRNNAQKTIVLVKNILYVIKCLRVGNNCQANCLYLINDLVRYLKTGVIPLGITIAHKIPIEFERSIYPFVEEYKKLEHKYVYITDLSKHIKSNKSDTDNSSSFEITFGVVSLLVHNSDGIIPKHAILYFYNGTDIWYVDPLSYNGIERKGGCVFSDLVIRYLFINIHGMSDNTFEPYVYCASVGIVDEKSFNESCYAINNVNPYDFSLKTPLNNSACAHLREDVLKLLRPKDGNFNLTKSNISCRAGNICDVLEQNETDFQEAKGVELLKEHVLTSNIDIVDVPTQFNYEYVPPKKRRYM